jgi:hypothetical protein
MTCGGEKTRLAPPISSRRPRTGPAAVAWNDPRPRQALAGTEVELIGSARISNCRSGGKAFSLRAGTRYDSRTSSTRTPPRAEGHTMRCRSALCSRRQGRPWRPGRTGAASVDEVRLGEVQSNTVIQMPATASESRARMTSSTSLSAAHSVYKAATQPFRASFRESGSNADTSDDAKRSRTSGGS